MANNVLDEAIEEFWRIVDDTKRSSPSYSWIRNSANWLYSPANFDLNSSASWRNSSANWDRSPANPYNNGLADPKERLAYKMKLVNELVEKHLKPNL